MELFIKFVIMILLWTELQYFRHDVNAQWGQFLNETWWGIWFRFSPTLAFIHMAFAFIQSDFQMKNSFQNQKDGKFTLRLLNYKWGIPFIKTSFFSSPVWVLRLLIASDKCIFFQAHQFSFQARHFPYTLAPWGP